MGLETQWGPSGKMLANRDFQLDAAQITGFKTKLQ